MIHNWLSLYLYHLKHNKIFNVLNILGLSLGVAGLIFAMLYWNDEHSYNAWNPNKENVFFTVTDLGEDKVWGSSSAPLGPALTASVPQVKEYCYLTGWYESDVLKYKEKKIVLSKVTDAQNNFFNFFPFRFIKGSSSTALNPNSIAISESIAKAIFGDEDPLNKQITYGDKNLVVKGVYSIKGKSSFEPDAVINAIGAKLKETETRWGMFSFGMLIKLKNPADAPLVREKIDALYYENTVKKNIAESGMSKEEYITRYGVTKVSLEQLKDLRLKSKVNDTAEGRGNYQFLLTMMGLSLLILIISIVNYSNLATANAIKRAKEVGIRKILGASKNNIIRQFIFETVITTSFSILCALMIVEISLPYYNIFLGKNIELHENTFYTQLIAIFIIVVLLAGIFPAVYVAKFETIKVLRGNFSRSKKGIWLRNAMLVLQFAVAFFFIIGSYIVHQQIKYVTTKDLGFNGKQIVDVYYRNPYNYREEGYRQKMSRNYSRVKEQMLKIRGVDEVAISSFKIGGGSYQQSTVSYKDISIAIQIMGMDFELPEILKLETVKGRFLSKNIASDTINSVIINETAAKMLNEANPINKYITYQEDKKLKIVGVVKDFHMFGPNIKILPMMLFQYKVENGQLQNCHEIYVKVAPEHMESALAGIEKLWVEEVDPDYAFNYGFVDKNFARSYENYVQQRNVFSLLNVVVILISLFGLFALASFSIQRRMKEIAIRKTLGADTILLLKELTWQYMLFCILGFIIALIPAWILLDKWLDNFAYRITISYAPFITGFLFLLALTLIIVISKAYAATNANVLKYLKYE
ncbi:ABC transporter permease [Flavobacterium rhizosphaerae]|uniref:ABC transporter permease n=1 Tax=Flavobacterium rhizosphaerae TaxID=3163298 RepID=A0ABW8YZD8_9FLAO